MTDKTIHGTAIADAVNAANDLRAHFGIDLLKDLPPAVPGNAKHCVLARAFNFDCVVVPHGPQWKVHMKTREQARILSKALGTSYVKTNDTLKRFDPREGYYGWIADLPVEVGRIAEAFDNDALPQKYLLNERQRFIFGHVADWESDGAPVEVIHREANNSWPPRKLSMAQVKASLRALEKKGFVIREESVGDLSCSGVSDYCWIPGAGTDKHEVYKV